MTTPYYEHPTAEGDRFDLLAYRYYGNPYAYAKEGSIGERNIGVIDQTAFESGLILQIPIMTTTQTKAANLPPWRR